MDEDMKSKIFIREYDEDRDIEAVEKLEKNCEMGSRKGLSIFTSTMTDPLCRIRLYPVHVMLVAELLENGDLVGVVRGCIKCVGTAGFEGAHVKMGCILGLRVSPRLRRKGIGLQLVKSIEGWMKRNGAEYSFLATEENNIASTNLFTLKCKYANFSSLVIYVQPVSLPAKDQSPDIKIEKLSIAEAISFYKNGLKDKHIYPVDVDEILKEKLSLGTWVSYFKEEDQYWIGSNRIKEKINEVVINGGSIPSSNWVIFSMWNTCEAYKLHLRKSQFLFKFLHATLGLARDKLFPCLKTTICDSFKKPFGFLFLYGLHGEGDRLGELMESVWNFTSKMAENVKDCKVIMTELGVSDPLREHVPQGSSLSCIKDLWYLKRVTGPTENDDGLVTSGSAGNVFVDPREF